MPETSIGTIRNTGIVATNPRVLPERDSMKEFSFTKIPSRGFMDISKQNYKIFLKRQRSGGGIIPFTAPIKRTMAQYNKERKTFMLGGLKGCERPIIPNIISSHNKKVIANYYQMHPS